MQIFNNLTTSFFQNPLLKRKTQILFQDEKKGINNKQKGKSLKESAQNDSRRFCL
jgi:hypothetical protein